MRTIESNQSGQTITMAVGDTIMVRLPENASTGFRWTLLSSGEPACAIIDEQREPPAPATPGAGGRHAWQLQARAAGECDFKLAYRRPWEEGSAPARQFDIHIRVTPQ
jgi:inhibitor of cysteine peptidase